MFYQHLFFIINTEWWIHIITPLCVQHSFFSPVSFVHIEVLIFIHYAVGYCTYIHYTSNEKNRVRGMGMEDFGVLWVWGFPQVFCGYRMGTGGDWNPIPTAALRIDAQSRDTPVNILTLIFEFDLVSVNVNQRAKYIGQGTRRYHTSPPVRSPFFSAVKPMTVCSTAYSTTVTMSYIISFLHRHRRHNTTLCDPGDIICNFL